MGASGAWARIRSFAAALVGRARFEQDLTDELASHLELRAADLEQSGLSAGAAMRQARMELGSVDVVREDVRASRGLRVVEAIRQDVRQASRALLKAPTFAITAIGTIALCLGANLTIFAVVDAVLLRGLPLADADRLVGLFNTYPRAGVPDDGASITNYEERAGQIPALAPMAIYRDGSAVVGESGATTREPVTLVSPEFFDVLGVPFATGSVTVTDRHETVTGSDLVTSGANPFEDGVVVTDGYWRAELRADPAAVGRTIRVDGMPRTVLAVLPASFRFLSSSARLYLPLVPRPDQRGPAARHAGSTTRMVARLAPGATLAEAQAQIDAHNAAMEATNPQARMMADAGFRTLVVPLRAHHVAAARPTLLLLQAGALVLLLLGAVNLVHLLLVRAIGRLREMAVRHALGVARMRIVSQVLVETTVLTLAGGLGGLVLGLAGIRGLAWLGTDRLPMGADVAVDAQLALVALAGAIALGVVIALPIAWFHLRSHDRIAQRFEGRGSVGAGAGVARLRQAFSVAQVALAFVLLSAAGSLALSLERVQGIDPGFVAGRVVTARLSLPRAQFASAADLLAFTERLAEAVRREPGVSAVGIGTNVPFSGITIKSAASVPGHVPREGEAPLGHYAYAVTGDYFAALGIPVHDGRTLDAADSRRAQLSCVVDDDFARHYWPGQRALDRQVYLGSTPRPGELPCTVVGVVGAMKQADPADGDAPGALYVPYVRNADRLVYLTVRTSASLDRAADWLARAVRRVNADVPLDDVRTMAARVADRLVTRRSPALLAALFAAVALVLTGLGVYGLFSYTVAEQRRELAVRIALGASAHEVRRPLLARLVLLVGAGCAVGVVGAWAAGASMQSLLYGVPATSAPVLATTAVVIAGLALAASALPLRRATRVSPMDALGDA